MSLIIKFESLPCFTFFGNIPILLKSMATLDTLSASVCFECRDLGMPKSVFGETR